MKKASFIIIIMCLLFITGCLISSNKKHKSILECHYDTVVDGKNKESKILLFFDDKNELIKYDYASKTIYDAIDYSHYKGLDEEAKRDFVFNDDELSITYKKTDTAPFIWHGDINSDHPTNYDKVKEYYLNKSYTCNKEISKQVDLKTVFSDLPFIIFKERIYFNDPYNYNYITSVNLEGKDKKVLLDEFVKILFILGDDMIVKKVDSSVTTYAKINVFDNKNITSLGNDLVFNHDLLYSDLGALKKIVKTSIVNLEADTLLSKISPIYNEKTISTNKDTIYYGDEQVYKGFDIKGLFVSGEILHFIDRSTIYKFDLEKKKVIDTLLLSEKPLLKHSFNDGVLVFATSLGIYKFEINSSSFVKLYDNNYDLNDLIYNNSKVIYTSKSARISDDLFNVTVFDMETNSSTEFRDVLNYQISLDNIYIITKDFKINVK